MEILQEKKHIFPLLVYFYTGIRWTEVGQAFTLHNYKIHKSSQRMSAITKAPTKLNFPLRIFSPQEFLKKFKADNIKQFKKVYS